MMFFQASMCLVGVSCRWNRAPTWCWSCPICITWNMGHWAWVQEGNFNPHPSWIWELRSKRLVFVSYQLPFVFISPKYYRLYGHYLTHELLISRSFIFICYNCNTRFSFCFRYMIVSSLIVLHPKMRIGDNNFS